MPFTIKVPYLVIIGISPKKTSLFSKTEFGEVLEKKKTLLKKQLQLLHGDSYDAEEVFSLNKKMDLSDD